MQDGAWYTTTVTLLFDPTGPSVDDELAALIADELMAIPDVITVRVGIGRAETVYRADVFAPDVMAARHRASKLAVGVAARLHIDAPHVLAVEATTDVDALPKGFRLSAEAAPLAGPRSGAEPRRPPD